MAYITHSHRSETYSRPAPAARIPEWMKRIYAALLLPIFLIIVIIRPSAFNTDDE